MKASNKIPSWLKFAAIALLALSVACQNLTNAADPTATPSVLKASPRVIAPPTTALSPQPNKTTANSAQLVDLRSVNPAIRLDLRYATTHNFMRRRLYKQPRCLLRAIVAEQLAAVQKDLEADGLGLKMYDCYRPLSVQKQMWKLVPDDRYVANPATGSRHNRGSAVDVTLVDRTGNELTMPTGFDDFTEQAATNYNGASAQAKQNRQRLKDAMTKHGFIPLQTEWWHFDAAKWAQFPVLDVPVEAVR
ncbi:M15 family metallopeptidase [Leptolyngbya sp. FACHB-321]|uniref:M15 family metallopeptidase n=1 Tax=Leptolyngbya sp. FACHB-321 TaxID=2692807 RepID=UPI001682686C|nr:M15 family metallopeptidase [Leptolyngbya sp. FACHB-321]